jgi:hypothetical protein
MIEEIEHVTCLDWVGLDWIGLDCIALHCIALHCLFDPKDVPTKYFGKIINK